MNLRLRILGLCGDDFVEGFEGLVELAVGEQSVGQATLCVEIIGLEIERTAVGCDGFFGLLELIVG